jgi:hypothetical protein
MRASEVTFDDARRIVRDHLLDRWTAQDGRLVVAERGFQDSTHWRVEASAVPVEEVLVEEGDDEVAPPPSLDDRAFLVDKATGAITELPVAGNEARWQSMTPWGPPS